MQQIPKIDVPRKVIVFSCGGGSFVEYEQVKALNEEKCQGGSTAKANGGNTAAEEGKGSAGQPGNRPSNAFFDQIIYGTDHVYTPTQFISEL